jgi:protein required for attachment to host cells
MSHNTRTWIVVADAARARIFVQEKHGEPLAALDQGDFHNPDSSHHTRDLGSDRPARSQESVGSARHAIEPKHDPRRMAAAAFAKDIAGYLEQGAMGKRYDRLAIVAPPHILGDLRKSLGKHTEALVVAELNKDLTKIPLHELPSHLESVIRL